MPRKEENIFENLLINENEDDIEGKEKMVPRGRIELPRSDGCERAWKTVLHSPRKSRIFALKSKKLTSILPGRISSFNS